VKGRVAGRVSEEAVTVLWTKRVSLLLEKNKDCDNDVVVSTQEGVRLAAGFVFAGEEQKQGV